MADYIISNDYKTMEEIWEELLRLHWDYLDTEESMEKLKMRRKLEDELNNFLSVVQHDRKFFLIETAHVFKQSVMKSNQFSAYKALMGFEAISQYANNLFRKPWRKEYRCIKLYAGYYQHEVKENLVDAEKMFEAMGYTLLPNRTLVLDGPICPDQVTNVSRDAMTAYVECQIMKRIFQGLVAMQLQTTWQEIFEFRETHIGTVEQAVKTMAYAIEKRRHRREKPYETNIPLYSSVCSGSTSHNQVLLYNNQRHIMPSMCSNNCGAHKSSCSNQFTHHSSIPHSKSLDHYHEPNKFEENYNASRHSFDHTVSSNYKNYDCIDGMHVADRSNGYDFSNGVGLYHQPNCNLMSGNLYNVPGNRYALPAKISFPESSVPHYSQLRNYNRSENYIDPNIGSCCHQTPHYEYPKSSMQKSKNSDTS